MPNEHILGEAARAFVPHPLPPADPPLLVAGEARRDRRRPRTSPYGRSDGPRSKLDPLRLRPQGSRALVADRERAGDAPRCRHIRIDQQHRPPGRCRGDLQLRGCSQPRPCPHRRSPRPAAEHAALARCASLRPAPNSQSGCEHNPRSAQPNRLCNTTHSTAIRGRMASMHQDVKPQLPLNACQSAAALKR